MDRINRMRRNVNHKKLAFVKIPVFILSVMSILFTFPSVAEAKEPITIFLAGDSTCAIKQRDKRPETGWGEMLQTLFDPQKVKIDNRALNGRSTKSFIDEGEWKKIIDAIKPGDY